MKKIKKGLAVVSALCTTTCLLSSLTVPQAYSTQKTEDGLHYVRHNYYVEITGCEDYVSDVVIPAEIDGLPVTAIGDNAFAFRYCSQFSLKSVTLPDTITRIGERAFFGSYELETLTIPENVQLIEPAFAADCPELRSIRVDSDNPYYTGKNGILFNDDMTEIVAFPAGLDLTSYTVSEDVTEIGATAFYGCETLENINLHDGITKMGTNSFSGCTALKSVNIPDNLTEIPNSAFNSCESLTEVTIPDGVTKIGVRAFAHCENLESVFIPDGVTSMGGSVFTNCSSLDNVVIPDSVVSVGNGMFARCGNLTNVTLPKNLTEIPSEMFAGCWALENIELPENIKVIRNSAFSGSALTSIVIPEGVTEIEYAAFQSCANLETIEIPESLVITGNYALGGYYCPTKWYENQPEGYVYAGNILYEYKGTLPENSELTIKDGTVSIGDGAFYGQSGLKSIVLPESVQNIADNSFHECENLESITFLNPECEFLGFECDMNEVISNETMIYGYTGSTAQVYAETYGKNFTALDSEVIVTAPPVTAVTTVPSEQTTTTVTTSVIPITSVPYTATYICTCGLSDHFHNIPATTSNNPVTTVATTTTSFTPITRMTSTTATYICTCGLSDHFHNIQTTTSTTPVTTISDVPIITETTEQTTTTTTTSSLCAMHLITTTTTTLTTPVITTDTETPESATTGTTIKLMGDISPNDKIDIYDAIEIAKFIIGKREFTEDEKLIADFNNDGKTDLYDAIDIAKKLIE